MAFWNNLISSLKHKPRNPTEFIKKFINDSKKGRVQLEIIRDNEILIQVDSLQQTPSWFKLFKINREEFKNGFAIFFILDQENLDHNPKYIELKKSEIKLLELNEMLDNIPIRTFVKFVESTNDPVKLGMEMKKVIDSFLKPKEHDPQAIFNLRYIDIQD